MDSIWIRAKDLFTGNDSAGVEKRRAADSGVDHFDRRKDDTAKLPGYFGCGLHVPHFAENRRNSDKTGHEICVDASGALQSRLPAEEVVRMRSSIVLTGALLGRLGQASFCDPGGCVIGDRPIDLHLKAFARFGCQIRREDDNF